MQPRKVHPAWHTVLMSRPDRRDTPTLHIGQRVRMSALGRERHPRYGDRRGVIVGQGSPSSWRVKFDERVNVQSIHGNYLEPEAAGTLSYGEQPEESVGGFSNKRKVRT